ncbi:MAG: DsbA family protein [Anaerolineales bacterium]|uniref:DsbA family protein n=1 Tax=Candidatus Villigracilis proximus TaxID=3140683 RepID=UPI003134A44F|nr:DsbA family protein [Anaerolineales bacterium]
MTEEQPIVIEEEKSKPAWTLWIAAGGCVVFLCAAVFVGTLIFIGPQFVQQFLPDQVQVAEELPRVVTQSNTMGNPDAPVHIIEYGDFQCPYCLKFWSETEPQLIEEYVNTDQVYFEYRAYPIIGPESSWAAEGAYCAGDQGRFWEFHDTLFANWSGENVGDYTKENLVKYAKALDLNMAEFESCLSEEKHKGTVEQDAAAAEANGIHATPTFFINGFKVEGAQPYSILKDLIEQALDGNLDTQNG